MKLGIEKTAMVRVRAGISYALTEAMEEGHLLAEPPAISGGAGLEYPFRSVTPPCEYVTVRIGGRAVSMENLRLRKAAPTSVNVTVGKRSREYLTDREVERLIEAAKQN